MRKILLMIIGMTSTAALAQSKEQVEVAVQVEALRLAMVAGGQKDLEALTSDSLSYGHSGGHIEDKKEFVESLVSGKSDFVSIELSNQTITVVDHVAVVRHDLHGVTNDSGKASEVNLHVLQVWQQRKDRWLLVARQAVKILKK